MSDPYAVVAIYVHDWVRTSAVVDTYLVDSCPLKASDCTGFMQYGTRSLAVRLLMITLKIMTLGLKG
jgi:hypothetical protein